MQCVCRMRQQRHVEAALCRRSLRRSASGARGLDTLNGRSGGQNVPVDHRSVIRRGACCRRYSGRWGDRGHMGLRGRQHWLQLRRARARCGLSEDRGRLGRPLRGLGRKGRLGRLLTLLDDGRGRSWGRRPRRGSNRPRRCKWGRRRRRNGARHGKWRVQLRAVVGRGRAIDRRWSGRGDGRMGGRGSLRLRRRCRWSPHWDRSLWSLCR